MTGRKQVLFWSKPLDAALRAGGSTDALACRTVPVFSAGFQLEKDGMAGTSQVGARPSRQMNCSL
jgi:hypothetical protein